jgi:hypothetical protein
LLKSNVEGAVIDPSIWVWVMGIGFSPVLSVITLDGVIRKFIFKSKGLTYKRTAVDGSFYYTNS